MKKLLFIITLFISVQTFGQGQKITIKVGGGASADLSNYFTKGQIDSINAGYYTTSQIDSIITVLRSEMSAGGVTLTQVDSTANVVRAEILAGITTGTLNVNGNASINSSGVITGSNLSGTNTGDETNASIKTKLGTDLTGKLNVSDTASMLTPYLPKNDSTIANRVTTLNNRTSNVDNTSDISKPISTATQNALNLKANANAVVDLTSNQTVGGKKTYSNDLKLSYIYPQIILNDVSGSYFTIWNLGNQMRFGTNTGTLGTSSWYTNSGDRADVGFNGSIIYTAPLGGLTTDSIVVKSTSDKKLKVIPASTFLMPTGNAATSTKLNTARNINGVAFDGTSDINPINGTGFVKASGATISYDNTTYARDDSTTARLSRKLDTSFKKNIYLINPLYHPNDSTIAIKDSAMLSWSNNSRIDSLGAIVDTKISTTTAASTYEPKITTKNTAFNKNFGTTSGTVADGGAVTTSLAGKMDTSFSQNSAIISIFQGLGKKTVAITMDGSSSGSRETLGAGTIELSPVYIKKKDTLTGVSFVIYSPGTFNAGGYNGLGLYSIDTTGTYTLVASTVNDTALFKSGYSVTKMVAFSSPYIAEKGIYMVALLQTGSSNVTSPQIMQLNTRDYGSTLTNGIKLFSTISVSNSSTALPSTISASATTKSTGGLYIELYK